MLARISPTINQAALPTPLPKQMLIIVGEGKIWVTDTMNFEIRGELFQKAYDCYLQAELNGKGDKTQWSDRGTPNKFPWNGIVRDLAGNLANNLKLTLR